MKDLVANGSLDPELREPLEASRGGFEDMGEALQGLQSALGAEDRDSAAQFLDELEAAARRVGDAGRAPGSRPRCPAVRVAAPEAQRTARNAGWIS